MSLLLLVAIAFTDPPPAPSVDVNQHYAYGEPIVLKMKNAPANAAILWRVDKPAKKKTPNQQECHVWAVPNSYSGTATTIVINPDGKTLTTAEYDFDFTVDPPAPDPVVDPPQAAKIKKHSSLMVVVVESSPSSVGQRIAERDAVKTSLRPLSIDWRILTPNPGAAEELKPYMARAALKKWPTYLAIVAPDEKTVIVEDACPTQISALAEVIRKASGS